MPQLPSDNYSKEELAEILNVFGSSEKYLEKHREWLWRNVEQHVRSKVELDAVDDAVKKFPASARGRKTNSLAPPII